MYLRIYIVVLQSESSNEDEDGILEAPQNTKIYTSLFQLDYLCKSNLHPPPRASPSS